MPEEFAGIVEIKEVTTIRTVNKYLQQGWKLLKVYTKHKGDLSPSENYVLHYLLGKPKPPE